MTRRASSGSGSTRLEPGSKCAGSAALVRGHRRTRTRTRTRGPSMGMPLLATVVGLLLLFLAGSSSAIESCSSDAGTETVLYNPNSRCSVMGMASPPVSLETCCGNVGDDQRRALRYDGVSDAAAERSDERSLQDSSACRSIRVATPYCRFCKLSDFTAEDELLVHYSTATAGADDSCCQTCRCMGDPDCTAFDGTRAAWIVCDGRKNDCLMSKQRCRKQTDHTGRACSWNKHMPDVWGGWDVDGSPCQADWAVSGYPTMTMYENKDMKLELTLFERGVIREATIETADGAFMLSSESCFENDPREVGANSARSAWRRMPPSQSSKSSSESERAPGSIPTAWSVSTPNEQEVLWRVDMGTSYVNIACNKPSSSGERSRLDIQSLFTTNPVLADDEGGFCATGSIDMGQSSGRASDYAFQEKCTFKNLPKLLTTCMAVASPTCSAGSLDSWQRWWCDNADLTHSPAAGDPDKCFRNLQRGDEKERAHSWANYLCRLNRVKDVDGCVSMISQFGYSEFLGKYSDGLVQTGNAVDSCAASPKDEYFKLADTTCAQGTFVEFLNINGDWEQLFFIPHDLPPCDDEMLFNGEDWPELFKYEFRFRQCSLSAACLVPNECEPTLGMTVDVNFVSSCDFVEQRPNCFNCPFNPDISVHPQRVCDAALVKEEVGSCDSCCLYNNFLNPNDDADGEDDLACRDLTVPRPFCDRSEPLQAQLCDLLPSKGGKLLLEVAMNSSELSCCKDCAAWGDPLIRTFDDHEAKLINCDGRNEFCVTKRKACELERDHLGHQCVYDEAVAAQIKRDADVGAYGSPCQANWTKSGYPEFVMYKTDDFTASITNGERSVITELLLDVDAGSYLFTAADCFNDDPFDAWTKASGSSAGINKGLQLTYDEIADREHERQWSIVDPFTRIFLRVVCIEIEASTGFIGGRRINIEALIDTTLDRGDTEELSGFCVDGDMPSLGSVNPYSSTCQEQEESIVDVCRGLTSATCTGNNFASNVKIWCETANLFKESLTRKRDCIANIFPGDSDHDAVARRWVKAYCETISSARDVGVSEGDWKKFCTSRVANSGILDVVADYGKGTILDSNDSPYCGNHIDRYKKRADSSKCMPGIEVYAKKGDELHELFFVPANKPFCDGRIEISAGEMPDIFEYPIVFRQCLIDPSCSLDTQCAPSQGFDIQYKFSHDDSICP